MACTLVSAKCVDHKLNLYQMEFWADSLSDIVPPSSMIMVGGSKAVITDSDGVKNYIYNSSTNEWKDDSYGIVSAEI